LTDLVTVAVGSGREGFEPLKIVERCAKTQATVRAMLCPCVPPLLALRRKMKARHTTRRLAPCSW
jgi:hypothetical protein